MNKLAIALVLISMGGMGLFAEGSQEENTFEPGTGYLGRGYTTDDQGFRGRGQLPMDRGYGYPNQNYQPMGQMSMRGGSYPNQNFQGQKQIQRPMQGAPGYANNGPVNLGSNVEILSLTGIIDLTDTDLPKLIVGDVTYELMVPYRLDYDIDITDGDEITISGFEVPAYRRTADTESANLMVTGATFDGKDYDLSMMNDEPMANGRRSAMMNNGGPAYGQKGRPGRSNNGSFQNNSRGWGQQPNNMTHRPYGRR